MEHSTHPTDGDRPGGDDLPPGAARSSADGAASSPPDGTTPSPARGAASADGLAHAAAQLAVLDASDPARHLLAEVLAAALAAFTLTRSTRDPLTDTAPGSAEESLAVLAGLDHLRSSLAALDAQWQVEAERRIARSDAERDLPLARRGKGAAQEIALARRTSPSAGSLSLASARRLILHLPGTSAALRAGRLTSEQASTIATALDGASPETCAQLDRLIAESPDALQGRGRRRLASDVRAVIQQLEPGGSRDRAERAARARHVTLSPRADGMAQLSAILPALDATAVARTLRARARSLRAEGSRTAVRALEADLLVEAVLCDQTVSGTPAGADTADGTAISPAAPHPASPRSRATSRPRLDVGVVITESALLDREDESECAVLEGYGTIPAHIITDTLRGRPPGRIIDHPDRSGGKTADPPGPGEEFDADAAAVFRQLYRRPRTGDLVAMESRARTFPVGLARLIRWRDVTCRTPWCNAVIRQIDHVQPHHRGGPTSLENGQGLCVRCNLAKELGHWSVRPLEEVIDGVPGAERADGGEGTGFSGRFRWESPHGAIGFSSPPSAIPGLPGPGRGDSAAAPTSAGQGSSAAQGSSTGQESSTGRDSPPSDEEGRP